MKIRIHVTKEVLKQSALCTQSRLGTNCAIALAVRDIFPDAFVGKRNYESPRLAIHPYSATDKFITLPNEAIDFIDEFDDAKWHQRMSMAPISFDIEVPECVVASIGLQEVDKILSESKTLERV